MVFKKKHSVENKVVDTKNNSEVALEDFQWWKVVVPLVIGIVGGLFVGYTTKLKQFEVNIFIAIMLSVCVLILLLDIRRQIHFCKSKLEK